MQVSDDILEPRAPKPVHFSECPVAIRDLPSCSMMGHGCSLSCLQLWYQHIDNCDFCIQHLIQETNECNIHHCKRVKEIWKLRENFRDFFSRNKLKPDGHYYQLINQSLKSLLSLDYMNIYYIQPRDTRFVSGRSSSTLFTNMVFECLEFLMKFQIAMKTSDMTIVGDDLKGLLDSDLLRPIA